MMHLIRVTAAYCCWQPPLRGKLQPMAENGTVKVRMEPAACGGDTQCGPWPAACGGRGGSSRSAVPQPAFSLEPPLHLQFNAGFSSLVCFSHSPAHMLSPGWGVGDNSRLGSGFGGGNVRLHLLNPTSNPHATVCHPGYSQSARG